MNEDEKSKMAQLWNKGQSTNQKIHEFTVGVDFILDHALLPYDCDASIAHAKMLKKIGILTTSELKKLEKELKNIKQLSEKDKFEIKQSDEDCHTAIENHLTKKLGDLGKKIHTARSRNDQVLTALRLYYKDELKEITTLVTNLFKALKAFAKKHKSTPLPGFTHTRKAMPSSVQMWASAFTQSSKDNLLLLDAAQKLIDQSPLGTAAGYGVPLNIDQKYTTKLLGFRIPQKNGIHAQLSRGKFESTILHSLTQIALDLNKMATDLIMFSMPEFNYFTLPDEFTTGSSIMPQKKNPDVLELVRAKYHILTGYEFQVKNISANTITGYHRDLQLIKEPTMNGIELAKDCIEIMTLVIKGLKVNKSKCKQAMTPELYATQEAYTLVQKGMPFRDAYKIVGKKYK